MKGNGTGREFRTELEAVAGARTATEAARLGLFVWLRGWKLRPGRVFWELDPGTGEWRRV